MIDALLRSVLWNQTGHIGHGRWPTSVCAMVKCSRTPLTSSQRLAFTRGSKGSTKHRLRRGSSFTLVAISTPQYFLCTFWRGGDTVDDVVKYSGYSSSPIQVQHKASTNWFFEPFSFPMAYVDPDIVQKMVDANNTQLFSFQRPGVDESILAIVISIINTAILSIVNVAMSSPPDCSQNIPEIGRWQDMPECDVGPHACNVTPNFNNCITARWVKVTMKLNNATLYCIIYHCQQSDETFGA